MVEAKERTAEGGRDSEVYYSPGRINDWLSSWAQLVEMATPTPGSTSRIDPTPGRPHGSFIVPPSLKLATVKADIEMAWDSLGPKTDGYKLVYLVMQGYPVLTAGDMLRIRRHIAFAVYLRAVEDMARSLGWK